MRALARKSPAVVKGQYDGNPALPQIVEQKGQVQVIAMQIAQMNDVGSQLAHPCDQFFRPAASPVTLHAEQTRTDQIVEMILPSPADLETPVVGRVTLTVGNVIRVSPFLAFSGDIDSDRSRAAVPANRVDMEYFHTINFSSDAIFRLNSASSLLITSLLSSAALSVADTTASAIR